MFTKLALAYSLLLISIVFPPLLLVSIPVLVLTLRHARDRYRTEREGQRYVNQLKAEQAYIRALQHQARGGF